MHRKAYLSNDTVKLELMSLPGKKERQLRDYIICTIHSYIMCFNLIYCYVKSHLSIRLDACGFILGPPIVLALQKPFIRMQKKGKMPNSISSVDYQCEYVQREGLTVQHDKTKSGNQVLTIDDLLAKGGIHCRQPYP